MHKIVLAIFTFIFCLSWAEVKVEKVLETTSIKEYNQWVMANKTECPELEPILIQTSCEIKGKLRRYTINYYQPDGEKLKEEILEDSLLYVSVAITNDRIVFRRRRLNDNFDAKVKDVQGNILFSLSNIKYGLVSTGIGIYVEGLSAECPAEKNTTLRVFSENGQEVGMLRGFSFVSFANFCLPIDRRYCIFQGSNAYSGVPIIMLNRNGKEVWRQDLKAPDVLSLFISKDGTQIGINHGSEVFVYNEDGILVHKYTPFGNHRFLVTSSAFSDNGEWLVTGLFDKINFYNNKSGSLVWEDVKTLKEKADTVRFVHVIKNGEFIIVLSRLHNMYIFDKNGQLLLIHNLGLGKYLTSRALHDEGPIRKKVIEYEVLTQQWFSDVFGKYLIINKDFSGIPKTQGTKKIVYKISEN